MANNIKGHDVEETFRALRKFLDIVLYVSILGEIIFFLSWANLAGCVMELIVWRIFRTFFLKKDVILKHPFSFLAFLSVFLARYIPLPATLVEGKPITYGFENPYETFFLETLMFIVASLAFYAVISNKTSKNSALQRTFYRFNFFSTDVRTLWILGFIGVLARIQNLAVANEVQYGDTGSKFLDGFLYLQFAPILMLFPSLSGISYNKRRSTFVLLYAALMFILSFAANSRQQMIYPIFTIVLLFILYIIKENISIFRLFSPAKLAFTFIILIFGLSFLSDLSLAMLSNRELRGDISRGELFDKTLETMQDEEQMEELRESSIEEQGTLQSYSSGWDEAYLSNFMLNRYGNMRVVDETLYYANRVGYGNQQMRNSFSEKSVAIFPLPFLSLVGIKVNKDDLTYSPGDMLYYVATGSTYVLGGFRVTSLVGDGLATFSYFCFPIIFILLYLSFKLMDTLVLYANGTVYFSILGLINVFGFVGMFRNSIGCIVPLTYILRGFWQQCFTFWLIVTIIKLIPKPNK